MCGRFTLRITSSELAKFFELLREPPWKPRYNIAPTQPVGVIRPSTEGRDFRLMHWGLIPSWAKDAKLGARMINARGESVATKPSFRSAFRRRRCLIPADGFYEWKKTGGRTKQPFYVLMRDEKPFAFAGLWERWTSDDGSELESCTIITTEPNELLSELHDRMPVVLAADDYDAWMNPGNEETGELERFLRPYPAERMKFYPIDTTVNNPQNDNPSCIEPAGEQGTLFEQ